MPLNLKLSAVKALPFDFEKEVADFIAAKKAHQKTIGEPAPSALHTLVENAVRTVPGSIDPPRADDYVADYEIEDDTPPPPTLDERKAELAAEAEAANTAALETIFPKLKRRLFQMRAGAARSVPLEQRTPEQIALAAAADAIDVKGIAIHMHLAEVEDAISDLTEATVDTYVMPAFPL